MLANELTVSYVYLGYGITLDLAPVAANRDTMRAGALLRALNVYKKRYLSRIGYTAAN